MIYLKYLKSTGQAVGVKTQPAKLGAPQDTDTIGFVQIESEAQAKNAWVDLDTLQIEYREPEPIDPMQGIRIHRNNLLALSDWTQLPDAPVDKTAWATYRQELRDLPETIDINNPVWPVSPADK